MPPKVGDSSGDVRVAKVYGKLQEAIDIFNSAEGHCPKYSTGSGGGVGTSRRRSAGE